MATARGCHRCTRAAAVRRKRPGPRRGGHGAPPISRPEARRSPRSYEPDTVEVVIQARVGGIALHLPAGGGEDGAPEGLGDDRVVLQDLLDYSHVLAPFVDVKRGSGKVERFVEGLAGVLALVPRHARAIAQFQSHDPE